MKSQAPKSGLSNIYRFGSDHHRVVTEDNRVNVIFQTPECMECEQKRTGDR